MIDRSPELCLVAFFLSKFGEFENNKTLPPSELGVTHWNEAYRLFFESLNAGRTSREFANSLNNARDAFDSHIKTSNRAGWKDKLGRPSPLSKTSQVIFAKYGTRQRRQVWEDVKTYIGGNISRSVYADLEAIRDSEQDEDMVSKTEGGRTVITSFRYERRPSLREDAFKAHGYGCAVCSFNFEKVYGEWGKQFIEVHHIEPLSLGNGKPKLVNAKTDLIVLCSNCHSMVHRKRGLTLTIEELKAKLTPQYRQALFLINGN